MTEDDKSVVNADILTIDSQLKSAKPNHSIIKQSVLSIKNILEGTAGSILAIEIMKYFPVIMGMLQ